MSYVLVDHDSKVVEYPYSIRQLRERHPNTSFPIDPTPGQLAEFNVFPVVSSTLPPHDDATDNIREIDPALEDDLWVRKWEVTPKSQQELDQIAHQRRESMTCSRLQGKIALKQAGLLADVEALITNPDTDDVVVMAWQDAAEWKRLSPMIVSLGLALGLSDTRLDQLFDAARSISV